MGEWGLVWLTIPRVMIILIFSLLYVIGGRKWKPVRRFAGGVFLGSSLLLLSLVTGSFKWWIAFAIIAYPIALSLGYGGDSIKEKLIKRTIYGLALGACGLIVASTTGLWLLGFYQLGLAFLASIFMGVFNPTEAVNEEAIIAVLSTILTVFMV